MNGTLSLLFYFSPRSWPPTQSARHPRFLVVPFQSVLYVNWEGPSTYRFSPLLLLFISSVYFMQFAVFLTKAQSTFALLAQQLWGKGPVSTIEKSRAFPIQLQQFTLPFSQPGGVHVLSFQASGALQTSPARFFLLLNNSTLTCSSCVFPFLVATSNQRRTIEGTRNPSRTLSFQDCVNLGYAFLSLKCLYFIQSEQEKNCIQAKQCKYSKLNKQLYMKNSGERVLAIVAYKTEAFQIKWLCELDAFASLAVWYFKDDTASGKSKQPIHVEVN